MCIQSCQDKEVMTLSRGPFKADDEDVMAFCTEDTLSYKFSPTFDTLDILHVFRFKFCCRKTWYYISTLLDFWHTLWLYVACRAYKLRFSTVIKWVCCFSWSLMEGLYQFDLRAFRAGGVNPSPPSRRITHANSPTLPHSNPWGPVLSVTLLWHHPCFYTSVAVS